MIQTIRFVLAAVVGLLAATLPHSSPIALSVAAVFEDAPDPESPAARTLQYRYKTLAKQLAQLAPVQQVLVPELEEFVQLVGLQQLKLIQRLWLAAQL